MAVVSLGKMNIKQARESYNYPTAHIRCENDQPCRSDYVYVRPLESIEGQEDYIFRSTHALDTYQHKLLTSPVRESKVLGIASTIYWGTYYNKKKASHSIACHRVLRFHEGNNRSRRSVRTMGVNTIAGYIESAEVEIEKEHYGKALRKIMYIPWLSRAFGSKVLAFLNPERVGVYDIHISRYLKRPDLSMKSTGNMTVEAEQTFDRFCNYLIEQAEHLNTSDTPKWADWDGKERKWRAVDFERAMFFLATHKG